jgi:hypothetical protein
MARLALDAPHPRALEKLDAQGFRAGLERLGGPVRERETVLARDQSPDTMPGQGRHQPEQLVRTDQLLVLVSQGAHATGAFFQDLQFGFVFRDLDLAGHAKAAVVADQIGDSPPHLHGLDRERDLGRIAAEPTDPAGVHARGMTAHRVLLDHQAAQSPPRQLQRRGASVQATADDDGIQGHAASPSPCRAASCVRLIGLIGGRIR